MRNQVLIIGGGLSGLSAAIHAIGHGIKPVILEKNRHLGGRVRSLFSADIETIIDNGQHVLSAAYHETKNLLIKIGSIDQIYFQKNFEAAFARGINSQIYFRTVPLPSPWNFFVPLLKHRRFTGIPFRDFIHFVQKTRNPDSVLLEKMSVAEWLDYCSQGSAIRKLLWHPLCYSILNTPPQQGSAFLLFRAISASFLGPSSQSGLGIPLNWLSEIFAGPAQKYIEKFGGEIHHFTAVKRIKVEGSKIQKIVTNKSEFAAPHVIMAIPPFSLLALLENSPVNILNDIRQWMNQLKYHPIMTINFYLKEELPFQFPLLLISSPFHWIFPHPKMEQETKLAGYAAVISAAHYYNDYSRDEMINLLASELSKLSGANHEIVKFKIVTEKRATVSQDTVFLKKRPAFETEIENLFLAGDWVNTGLPATIEGAVLSGKLAVEAMLRKSSISGSI
ncbi:MAG: FAD-dependent oxidoreductase [Calditrichaeota bacterium]|nr:FAD-dependent oxidoreductase [Calditrichota bacterium]RQW05648.1 MAG: FAD-dependent oxidoreductase [Calditrichota bacterium]